MHYYLLIIMNFKSDNVQDFTEKNSHLFNCIGIQNYLRFINFIINFIQTNFNCNLHLFHINFALIIKIYYFGYYYLLLMTPSIYC